MPFEVVITLPWQALNLAADAAKDRMNSGANKALNHATVRSRNWLTRYKDELMGALGELAVAQWFGMPNFKPPLGTFHSIPDCNGVEVRSTDIETGRLIVRDNDPSDRAYVLCLVRGPDVVLAGWMVGRDAKHNQWLSNPHGYRPCWMVPRAALLPMHELRYGAMSIGETA